MILRDRWLPLALRRIAGLGERGEQRLFVGACGHAHVPSCFPLDCRGSGEWVSRGIVQDDRDHGRLQAGRAIHWQIDRLRGLRLHPVAEAAERADGALHDRLDLGAVLVVIGEWRQRDLRLTRLAIAQDQ